MELMDLMATYQETAYERLCRCVVCVHRVCARVCLCVRARACDRVHV